MSAMLNKNVERSIVAVLVMQLMGCGTLLYPERRGQKAGHVDIGVVLLDAIGLLFFLIPGIIAFAVDFSNGTIYLPGTAGISSREIKFDPKRTTLAEIENIIKDETGRTVKLTQSNLKVSRLHSKNEVTAQLAQAQKEINQNRLVSL